MIFKIIAYTSIVLAPLLSGILGIIMMVPLSIIQVLGINKIYVAYLSTLCGGVALVYLYFLSFNLLQVNFGFLTFLLIFIPVLFNDIWRMNNRPNREFEKKMGIFETIGLLIGAYLCIL